MVLNLRGWFAVPERHEHHAYAASVRQNRRARQVSALRHFGSAILVVRRRHVLGFIRPVTGDGGVIESMVEHRDSVPYSEFCDRVVFGGLQYHPGAAQCPRTDQPARSEAS